MTAAMRFRIGKNIYPTATVDRLTLRHWLQIEQETRALNRPMTWTDVRAMMTRIGNMPREDVDTDPDFPWFVGIMVWASRYDSGETDLSLIDAVDFALDDLEFLPEPDDHKKAAGPRKPRPAKASGRGGKSPAAPRAAAAKASPAKASASTSSRA